MSGRACDGLIALRAWIRHEDQLAASGRAVLPDVARGDARMARAYDALAEAYRGLTEWVGLPPNPDLLLLLGPVGELIHAVTCQTKEGWAAFRRGVARRYSSIPFPTPLTDAGHVFQSFAELRVHLRQKQLPGITAIEVHPWLATSRRRADFRLTAVTERSVYVEVVMLSDDPARDNIVCCKYRARLVMKLLAYERFGLEPPVVIGADDLSPQRLEIKMREIMYRLGLPLPPPMAWCHGGMA